MINEYAKYGLLVLPETSLPPLKTSCLLYSVKKEDGVIIAAMGIYDRFSEGLALDLEDIKLQMLEALYGDLPTVIDYLGISPEDYDLSINTQCIKKQAIDESTADPLNQTFTYGVKLVLKFTKNTLDKSPEDMV